MGEPRIQGGPGSTVRPATPPAALPQRTTQPGDGKGVRIAVLDTGMFEHEWLKGAVQTAPNSADVWDVDSDGYGDAESGHGTFIAGLIRQVAPSASVYAVKVLNSHGVGDDLGVAKAMERLPADVDIVNLSLGGYTDNERAPAGDRDRDRGPGRESHRRGGGRQPRRDPAVLAGGVRAGAGDRRRRREGRRVAPRRATATTARGSMRPLAARTSSPRSRAR